MPPYLAAGACFCGLNVATSLVGPWPGLPPLGALAALAAADLRWERLATLGIALLLLGRATTTTGSGRPGAAAPAAALLTS